MQSDLRIKIYDEFYEQVQLKAYRNGWDIAHLGRRLIYLWVRGEVSVGNPKPQYWPHKQGRLIPTGFNIETDIKQAFKAKAHEAGWEMSPLLSTLFNLWLKGLIDPGTPVNKWDDRHTVIEEGKIVDRYTLAEASEILGVSPATLRKRLTRPKQRGQLFRITPEELEDLRQQFLYV